MVYVEDVGTTLDIALDELESFLDSEAHASVHSDDARNLEAVETTGPTIALACERNVDGDWKKSRTR